MCVIFDPTKALKIKKDIKVQRMYATIQKLHKKHPGSLLFHNDSEKKTRSQKDKQ